MFLVVRVMNNLRRHEEAAAPKPTPEVQLLTEIRDLLKKT